MLHIVNTVIILSLNVFMESFSFYSPVSTLHSSLLCPLCQSFLLSSSFFLPLSCFVTNSFPLLFLSLDSQNHSKAQIPLYLMQNTSVGGMLLLKKEIQLSNAKNTFVLHKKTVCFSALDLLVQLQGVNMCGSIQQSQLYLSNSLHLHYTA